MDIRNRLKIIFSDLFNLDTTLLESKITINHIENWDSLNHLNLIIAIENEFEINIVPDDFPKLYKDFVTISKYISDRIK